MSLLLLFRPRGGDVAGIVGGPGTILRIDRPLGPYRTHHTAGLVPRPEGQAAQPGGFRIDRPTVGGVE